MPHISVSLVDLSMALCCNLRLREKMEENKLREGTRNDIVIKKTLPLKLIQLRQVKLYQYKIMEWDYITC